MSRRAPDVSLGAWGSLIHHARQQGGVVTVRQAIACGVARSTFDARIAREGWERPFPGVALLPGIVADGPALACAAVLSVGDPAVLSGVSALALHQVTDAWPETMDLVVPATQRRMSPAGVRIRRTRTLLSGDVQRRRGIRVASVPRALLDASATATMEQLRALLIDARQRRRTTITRVVERARRSPSARASHWTCHLARS